MKRLIKSVTAIAAAVIAVASCQQKELAAPATLEQAVRFYALTPDTRAYFGAPEGNSYPVSWSEGDKVKASLNFASGLNADVKYDEAGRPFFDITFKEATAETYNIVAMCPADAAMGFYGSTANNPNTVNMELPAVQTSGEGTPDAKAMIIAAANELGTSLPDAVSLQFHHVTAYARMQFTNLALGDATVSSISITADTDIAGRFLYHPFADDEYDAGEVAVNGTSGIKTISVNTTTVSNVWFAIAPVYVGALEITINTDKGTFSKKITPDRSFQSGHIALINVDMSGVDIESPKTYKRAESLADLVVGSKVIVAAQDANYAISTTQNTNNRAQASVTKNEDGSLILTPAANVEIFQLENGSASGTFALRALGEDAPGYIWAAGGTGSSNYLKTTSTLSLASSWNISFTEGVISVVSADANVKRNTLRYNAGSSIFSCYATGSQSAIALYVSEDEAPVDVKTFIVSPLTLNVAADATNATIEVVSNVDWTVTFPAGVSGSPASGNGNATIALSFAANTDTQAKSYEIVVATANADVATQRYTVTLNQAAAAAGTTTIAEVLEACSTLAEGSVSEEIFEVQNATVMAAYKAYAVLDDGTGTIIAYKSNHGFVAGDILTVSGYVKNYYKLLEFTNANSVNVTMTKTGDAPTIIYPKPLELTATELDAYATEAIKPVDYVAATGRLDGYDITIEGSDIKVSLQGNVAAYNGKEVEVMGYAAGYNASSKKMTVILTEIQEIAGSATLTVNPTSLSFGANGGETEITVDSDNANWTVSSTESWLSFQKGTNSVVVTAAANTDAARTGTITFTHATESTLTATVTVSQSAPAPAGSWELVTNAADLMDGDIVTFYAHETYKVSGQSYEAWHAVGHYNGTFFGYVAVNANEDDTYFTSEDAVYTFTLNGSAANGWTLSGEDGYLYVKEKNKVSCQETATTWTIAIDSETGKVACEQVLEADGNTYRMQWNSNSGNARFSAYAATQKDPKLFRLNKK